MTLFFENTHTLLFRTMILSGPPPASDVQTITFKPLVTRTCMYAAKLRERTPEVLLQRSTIVRTSLKWMPCALFPLVLAYSALSIDEIWSVVGTHVESKTKRISKGVSGKQKRPRKII